MNLPQSADLAKILAEEAGRKGFFRRHRLKLIGGGALALLVLGFFFFSGGEGISYVTGKVESGTLTVTVTATGTLEPTHQVDVGSEISGRIFEVTVDFNDRVTKGQVLARLDTSQLEARVVQSTANLAAARAKVADAEATAREAKLKRDRAAGLLARHAVSQADMDAAEANLARAEAGIESAKAQVMLAEAQLKGDQDNLAKAEIRSPIDGIVLSREVEAGQTVAASLQAPVLFKLATDLAEMELHVDIDVADIGRVASGQKASFTVDAYPNRSFEAVITGVHNAPEEVENVVNYEAVLAVANTDESLKPGMPATAEITTEVIENALMVPNGALRFTPPGAENGRGTRAEAGTGRVWMLDPFGEPVAHDVKTGPSDGRRTAILESGLKEGDEVLVDLARAGANTNARVPAIRIR